MATIDDVYALLQTVDGKVDQLIAACITNAAGADIAADIIAIKADTDSILIDTGTTLDNKIDAIDTIVDAITLKTANLPSDPADQSLLIAAIGAIPGSGAVWEETVAGHVLAGTMGAFVTKVKSTYGL